MRVVRVLPLLALLPLFACNPPLAENEAPSVRVLEPRPQRARNDPNQIYPANALNPIDLIVVLRDRDGDSPLDLRVYSDPTPTTVDDPVEELELRAEALAQETRDLEIELRALYPDDEERQEKAGNITDGALVSLTLEEGLPEGLQALILIVTDNQEATPERRVRLEFNVNPSLSPPVPGIQPAAPTTLDELVGSLAEPSVDPDGGQPFYSWRWTHLGTGEQQPPNAPGIGFPAVLPAVQTAKGDTWAFCITAWDSDDGTDPGPNAPQVVGCTEVTVVNAPPGAPGAIDLQPARPTAASPLHCIVATDATDPDGDPVTYSYVWARGGTAVPGFTDPWLPPEAIGPNEAWTCVVTANDDDLTGGDRTSPSRTTGDATVVMPASAPAGFRVISGLPGRRAGDAFAIAGLETARGVVVGDPSDDELGTGHGSVSSLRGGAITPNATLPSDSRVRGLPATRLGSALALGDLDGDGQLDVVAAGEGGAWVVFGGSLTTNGVFSVDDNAGVAVAHIESDPLDVAFGFAVSVGDLRPASSQPEVAVSRIEAGVANVVRVFDGSGLARGDELSATTTVAVVTGPGPDDGFGQAVHAERDLTGDGVADLVVADPVSAVVRVFSGGAGLSGNVAASSASVVITGSGTSELGFAIATLDVDGDGVADLVLGAPGEDAVGVFYGGGGFAGARTFASADARLEGATGSRFGAGLGVLPAPGGSSLADALVVSAPALDGGSPSTPIVGAGAVYTWLASTLESATQPVQAGSARLTLIGSAADGALASAALHGDIDGDGFPDLAVGAPGAFSDAGRIYLIYSSPL